MLIKKPMIVVMIALLSTAAGVQARGNIERGGDLTFDCVECHGRDGNGSFETPAIAGLDEAYLLEQLRGFYSKKKKSTDGIMHLYTEDLKDQDLQDLAAYYASLKGK